MSKFSKSFKNIIASCLLATFSFIAFAPSAFAGLAYSGLDRQSSGSEVKVAFYLAFDSSYPTNGEAFSAAQLAMTRVSNVMCESKSGYVFSYNYSTNKVLAYQSASVTPAGTNSTSAVTGTAAAQTFTGTAPLGDLNLASPAFSGTGYATAGQVITTTDNQTMTLNQCAGMRFVPPSGAKPDVLILSNTAVTGAPAVLTVQGIAPTTDAGAYKIVKALTPVGTNAASASLTATAAAQTFTGTATTAAGLSEVPNATNLSTVTSVRCMAFGK